MDTHALTEDRSLSWPCRSVFRMVGRTGVTVMMQAKSFTSERITVLTSGMRVKEVADACRSAALAFAWSASMWGKRELALWLAGPYARAVSSASHEPHEVPSRAGRALAGPLSPLAADAVVRVVEEAHQRVLDELRGSFGIHWSARDVLDEGLVVGVVDHEGASGYAPVDCASMRLVDRVRALFAADYLTRPDEYSLFGVCDGCGAATFDAGESHALECAAAPISVRPRSGARRMTLDFGAEGEESGVVARFDLARALPHVYIDYDGDADGEDADEDEETPRVPTRIFTLGDEAAPLIEVVGEIEIDVDTTDLANDDLDDEGDIRDTLIDPVELQGMFP